LASSTSCRANPSTRSRHTWSARPKTNARRSEGQNKKTSAGTSAPSPSARDPPRARSDHLRGGEELARVPKHDRVPFALCFFVSEHERSQFGFFVSQSPRVRVVRVVRVVVVRVAHVAFPSPPRRQPRVSPSQTGNPLVFQRASHRRGARARVSRDRERTRVVIRDRRLFRRSVRESAGFVRRAERPSKRRRRALRPERDARGVRRRVSNDARRRD
jgi:hypothetical protein